MPGNRCILSGKVSMNHLNVSGAFHNLNGITQNASVIFLHILSLHFI